MDNKEFRKQAHLLVDWIADYLDEVENYPVKSQVQPGDVFNSLPDFAPTESEEMDQIIHDFKTKVLPGITHWQSPNFFAYFPANSSYPSVLAEMLTATLGAQCMIWETSPAAAELEEKMMIWLKGITGIPSCWSGVIQDTASTATLAAILTARERCANFESNKSGPEEFKGLRVYCSTETHSSIEKAVKIAGLGSSNLVKVKVDKDFRMDFVALRQAIESDIEDGLTPACVIATLGTTSCTAIDPLSEIAKITSRYDIWLHIDAAFAGTALFLPEYRSMIEGIEHADSFVFNPHKWMFTNFDCSAYFVKDPELLIRTFEILPEYLKTSTRGKVNDYRDWGVPLGRRFRALKLWFVIRSFGVDGIRNKVAEHIRLANWLKGRVLEDNRFELLAPVTMNVVCFRVHPLGIAGIEELNRLNEKLLNQLNGTGKIYITHTKLNGCFTLRMVIAQTYVEQRHVEAAWEQIRKMADEVCA
ncbi:MAG: pyridoxal phosphate-dependent decarboxylase family protein [Bacteroidales bacterium]